MRKLILLLFLCVPLMMSAKCEKSKQLASNTLAAAVSTPVSACLECRTGNHTAPFLAGTIYDKMTKKELKAFANKDKSLIGVACQSALFYLKGELDLWLDGNLSDEMKADGCSAAKCSDKGLSWINSKCPG